MFGVFLAACSSAFGELTDSIGKRWMQDGEESYYTFGFLTQISSALLIALAGFWLHNLVFSADSLFTFIPRALVGILEIHLGIIAITRVDRGAIGFIRLATIPLLLLIDFSLGYILAPFQIAGMFLIVAPIFVLFFLESSNRKGVVLALFVAVLAAIDISLYKYDITHFNSVESEQAVIALILALYFYAVAVFIRKENPLVYLRQPIYILQMSSSGLAYMIGSFAYLFGPASIITTALRGLSVLFAVVSGRMYFKEKRFFVRTSFFLLIVAGLYLLL